MKEMKSLRLLDVFRGLFEMGGVDYPVMRRILQLKLTMDGRRVPTIIGSSRPNTKKDSWSNRPEKDKNYFFGSLWLYLIMGGISSLFVGLGDNFIFQMSLVMGILMFMIATSLISDFSSVLLDIRDRNILSTKPVNRKTIAAAKMMHIFFYMFFLTGALAAVPLIVGLLRHGVGFVAIFLVELILMDLLIMVITALIYWGVLKFFDGEKLKDFINYVQIGLTIVLAVGYQLMVRLFDFVNLDVVFQPRWWQFAVPPVWFGAPYELLLHGDGQSLYILFALVTVIVPMIAFFIYLKLMPSFEKNLQKLADPGSRKKAGSGRWLKRSSRILCSSPREQAFFRFAWTVIGNEREFKLKVYPSLGFSIIFPFIFLFTNIDDTGLLGLAGTKLYLAIYSCALLVPTVVLMLEYSSSYKGAWIYRVMPLEDSVAVHRGTLIAAVVRLIVPLFALEALIFGGLFGIGILPDLIAAGLAILCYAVISYRHLVMSFPFSEPFDTARQNNGLRTIPLLILLGGMSLVHFAVTFIGIGIYVYVAVLLASNWFLWQRGFRVGKSGVRN